MPLIGPTNAADLRRIAGSVRLAERFVVYILSYTARYLIDNARENQTGGYPAYIFR
jgi:hypothetical protein